MNVNIKNRIALVTGAGGAIGSAIAKELAKNGAHIIVNDVNEENGLSLVKEIIDMGSKAIFIKSDVGNGKETKKMSQDIINKFGKIDILVNNAGINTPADKRDIFSRFEDDEWEKIICVDLKGVYYCSKPVIQNMIENNYGKIINIASVIGFAPFRLQSPFTAAKSAVIGLTKAMALELAPYNINVNGVIPGSILMEKTKKHFYSNKKIADSLLSHIPFKRPGSPLDIANAVLYLSSDDSSYMTGNVMAVDGGWTCGYNFLI